MQPVPGYGVSTPYGKKGWSCGFHTGADFAAPMGAQIVAPIAGQIRHRNYGAAFGRHQFAISPDPGQPFAAGEVFFAHTSTRPADGKRVKAGDKIAKVASEGNSTGPHLHMEYHPRQKGTWGCDVVANPQPIIDWKDQEDDMPLTDKDIERIADAVANRTNMTIGDYTSNGNPKDDTEGLRADARLRRIETLVQKIAKKVGA